MFRSQPIRDEEPAAANVAACGVSAPSHDPDGTIPTQPAMYFSASSTKAAVFMRLTSERTNETLLKMRVRFFSGSASATNCS
jgi:hypothetical protein